MEPILLLYSTFTGNTQEAMTKLHGQLQTAFPEKEFLLQDVQDVNPKELPQYRRIIFGASTLDSLMTPNTEFFFSDLDSAKVTFPNSTFALFCLGDSSYEVFCGAQELIKQKLITLKATIYPLLHKIDGIPGQQEQEKLFEWAEKFLEDTIAG